MTDTHIRVCFIFIIISTLSCKTINYGCCDKLIIEANKNLYKQSKSKLTSDTIFSLIFRVRDIFIKDKIDLKGVVFFIHSESLIHGSSRMISRVIRDDDKKTYFTDIYHY